MKALLYCFILFSFAHTWELFTSEAGNFSVLTPTKLEANRQDIPSDLGRIEYYTFSCHSDDANDSNFAYVVSFAIYPEDMIHEDSAQIKEEFLLSSMEAAAENLKGEVVYSNPEVQQGVDGLLGRIEYNEGSAVMKTKMFFVNDRFYTLQVFTTKENSLNKDIDKFFGSFRFLDLTKHSNPNSNPNSN